ncbi:MAG TPA: hypothetical protein VKD65_11400 [Candidatus Angelobacter sp.]|nr:hypothetical protein [Candidatus Angelobacter sp.]
MKDTLEKINRMLADGVIEKYAIGGGVGATYYLEPTATLNLDIFVTVLDDSENSSKPLSAIYEYLTKRGCKPEGEHIVIETWPVQFLSPNGMLEKEALSEAIQTDAGGVSTWVLKAEHLVAIALQTGRKKDHARILQFFEQKAVDRDKLHKILARHGLLTKWTNFKKRFLDE